MTVPFIWSSHHKNCTAYLMQTCIWDMRPVFCFFDACLGGPKSIVISQPDQLQNCFLWRAGVLRDKFSSTMYMSLCTCTFIPLHGD